MRPWECGPGEGGGLRRADPGSPGSDMEGNCVPWWERVEGTSRPRYSSACVWGALRPTSSKLDALSSKPQATG